MTEESAPELRAVIDRFNSSRETLVQLGERLRALALAEETSSEAAASIATAAQKLDETAQRLQELTHVATTAQAQLQAAVEAAANFLEATDLNQLKQTLQEVSAATSESIPETIRSSSEQISSRIEERLAALEGRLAELEQTRQNEAQLRAQLDKVREQLPARKLERLGLAQPAQP